MLSRCLLRFCPVVLEDWRGHPTELQHLPKLHINLPHIYMLTQCLVFPICEMAWPAFFVLSLFFFGGLLRLHDHGPKSVLLQFTTVPTPGVAADSWTRHPGRQAFFCECALVVGACTRQFTCHARSLAQENNGRWSIWSCGKAWSRSGGPEWSTSRKRCSLTDVVLILEWSLGWPPKRKLHRSIAWGYVGW